MDQGPHSQDQSGGMHDVHGQWPENGSPYQSQHHTPHHEYSGFTFNTMHMEPVYNNPTMPPPPRTQPQLHPLVTTPWPSMLTSTQSSYTTPVTGTPTYTPPPVTTPVNTTPMSAPPTSGRQYDRPRRTLTDQDRRKMCEYAEKNPGAKQTEIALLFGVERSTVSKVLRHKEKYLTQDDASKAQVKAKGKFPDVERALSNWVRNEKKNNQPLDDKRIMDKFRHFAQTVRDPDQQLNAVDDSWLEAFKQKNGLGGAKSRKSSIADEMDAKPSTESPTSPQIKRNASPSGIRSLKQQKSIKKIKSESPPASLGETVSGHRPYASIGSALTGVTSTSYSPVAVNAPAFSMNMFSSPQPVQPVHAPTNAGYQPRQRSQTFPIRTTSDNVSYPSTSTASEAPLHDFLLQGDPSPLLETPELLSLDTSYDSFLPTPAFSKEETTSPPLGIPTSSPMTPPDAMHSDLMHPVMAPSLDETRRALEVVWNFFHGQHSLDAQELNAIGSMMNKLKLQSGQVADMRSGLHPIHENAFNLARTTAD